MTVGIDGNKWYVSNGLGLDSPKSVYVFADTLRQALDGYHAITGEEHDRLPWMDILMDCTVCEYQNKLKVKGDDA